MIQSKYIKLARVMIILVSIQLLNYGIILPSVVSFTASATLCKPQNQVILAHALDDLFHCDNQNNSGQEDFPNESDVLNDEKDFELIEDLFLKNQCLTANNSCCKFLLFNNTAASLDQPELNTPPPKMA